MKWFSLLCLFLVVACGATPKQEGAVAQTGCTIIAALVGTPEEQSLCASAGDLVELGESIRRERDDARDAGAPPRHVTRCRIVPETTVCASEPEIARAIARKKAGEP